MSGERSVEFLSRTDFMCNIPSIEVNEMGANAFTLSISNCSTSSWVKTVS